MGNHTAGGATFLQALSSPLSCARRCQAVNTRERAVLARQLDAVVQLNAAQPATSKLLDAALRAVQSNFSRGNFLFVWSECSSLSASVNR